MIEEILAEARQLLDTGDFEATAAACRQAIEIDASDYRAHDILGHVAIRHRRNAEALKCFKEAVRLQPDNIQNLNNLGLSLKEFGDFDGARAQFEKAVEIDPDYAPSYYNLISIGRFAADDPVISRLEALASAPTGSPVHDSLTHFALGKVYNDIDEFDKAFAQFEKANRLQDHSYDHQNTLHMFARAKSVFTRDLMETRKGQGNPSDAPVFIVGMPRSGSSLIEELLCRNSDITGYSERTEIAQIARRLLTAHPSNAPYPEVIPHISGEQFSKLGDLYLMLLGQVHQLSARIVDKNILNHAAAGFIRLLFPNAAIVHIARDPIDTCLSCYFQNFREGMEFSFNLENLGKRYAAYADLMRHWEEVMGESLYAVKYETLVADKNAEIARLFNHIGMATPDEAVLEKPAARAIPTASVWQARQPVYGRSVKRWQNYEKHLGPLFKAFEDAGLKIETA